MKDLKSLIESDKSSEEILQEGFITKSHLEEIAKRVLLVEATPNGIYQLRLLVEEIQKRGNVGHSFSIWVDPDAEDGGTRIGWDGDGADQIKTIG